MPRLGVLKRGVEQDYAVPAFSEFKARDQDLENREDAMEFQGETYLFNFSLVAITFAAVTALVMLIRQSMGSGLSRFDIHLIATYLSYGFTLAILALIPPLISLLNVSSQALWSISSIVALLIFIPMQMRVIVRRRIASKRPAPLVVKISWAVHWIGILVLMVNASGVLMQGAHLYAFSLTSSLAVVMFMFSRRVASVFGELPQDGFDPDRG